VSKVGTDGAPGGVATGTVGWGTGTVVVVVVVVRGAMVVVDVGLEGTVVVGITDVTVVHVTDVGALVTVVVAVVTDVGPVVVTMVVVGDTTVVEVVVGPPGVGTPVTDGRDVSAPAGVVPCAVTNPADTNRATPTTLIPIRRAVPERDLDRRPLCPSCPCCTATPIAPQGGPEAGRITWRCPHWQPG